MLYKLTATNFGSIKGTQTLDLTMSAKVPFDARRHTKGPDRIRLPKVAAILGPNASGKTTFLRVMSFLSNFVSNSAMWPPELEVPAPPFSDPKGLGQNTTVEAEIVAEWLTPGKPRPYRYSVVIAPQERTGRQVCKEILEYKPQKQWVSVAERKSDKVTFRRELAHLNGSVPTTALERRNASVFSMLKQFASSDEYVKSILNGVGKVFSNLHHWRGYYSFPDMVAENYAKSPEALESLNRIIRRVDLGISDVNVVEIPSESEEKKSRWSLTFFHDGLSSPLSFYSESQGTKNFVGLFPVLHMALTKGGIALMDEMDSDLHPELLREIVGWFLDPEFNRNGAQLITTCNNASVLDQLKKEEIFFTYKTPEGETHLYGLKDIPGVKRNENFYREYLAGRYGAVPNIG